MLRKHLHLFFLVSRHVYLLLQFASEDRISLYQFIPVYKHCLEKLVPAVSVRRLYVVDTIFCRAWVFAFYMFTGWANNGIFRLILPHFIYYYFIIIIINLCFFALFSEFIYLLLRCLHSDFHVFSNVQKVLVILLPQQGGQVLPVLPSEEDDVGSPAMSILYRPLEGSVSPQWDYSQFCKGN